MARASRGIPPPVDLRSDTVTRPSPAMRRAMAEAEVGDDVMGEDPTVRRLEERAAEILGLPASLFCVSGVMANEVAIAVWTRPGQEVIVEERSHPLEHELGGMAAISGVIPRVVPSTRGVLEREVVASAIRHGPYYLSDTGLIVAENTHNMWGGTVTGPARSAALVEVAGRHGVPIHLDGARLFNAAVASGVSVSELCRGYSSVMISLSKGLGAPVGSILAGSEEFVREARRVRKRLGGGWRQAGVLAAAGLVALEESPPLLPLDHARARRLAEVAAAARFEVESASVETNIVILGTGACPAAEVVERLAARGVLSLHFSPATLRLVTHRDLDDEAMIRATQALGHGPG